MQGIAALPTGMAPEGAPQDAPAIGQLSAQEASTLGRLLTKVSSEEIDQLRELADDLKSFSEPELKDFLGGVDYIMANAKNYKQSVRNLIAHGIVQPGDLPADYVPTFYSILRQMIVDAMGATKEAAPEGFAKGGLASMAEKVRKAGRDGDTILAHINPQEAKMLKDAGGYGSINPKTGLPEFKSFWTKVGTFLKKAAPVILPIALSFIPGLGTAVGAAIGGALGVSAGTAASLSGALIGAVGSGVGGLIAGQKPGQALLSAALGGIGGYAMSTLAPSGLSGLFSGGATGAEGAAAAGSFDGGGGGDVAGSAPRGDFPNTVTEPTVKPNVPVPNSRANFMAGGPEMFIDGKGYIPSAAATAEPVSGGLGTLFDGKIGETLKNPWVIAGLAGTAGMMLGGSGKKSNDSSAVAQGPTGVQLLAQNPQQYGFNINDFRARPAPAVRVVPGVSPAFPNGYNGQLPGLYAEGGPVAQGHIAGPGTGTSDSIPALLSDGEFVLTAKAVRGAGQGNRLKGAKRLYKLMNELEKRA